MSFIRAFIPLKHPACARARLQEALTSKQRQSMYSTLVRRLVGALREVPLVQDVVIVTSSAEVENLAAHLGVRVMHQVRDEGINAALEAAIAAFAGQQSSTALIVPGDLPLVSADSLNALLQAAQPLQRGVTIVPDRRHVGTNALVCTPADAIRLRFGPNSFAEHLRTAQEHGLEVRIFESGALSLDIDEPEDLDAWRGYDGAENVHASTTPPSSLAATRSADG